MESRDLFQVINGMMVDDMEWRAITCGGRQLKDGWYFMPDGFEDPINYDPFATEVEAAKYGKMWLSVRRALKEFDP